MNNDVIYDGMQNVWTVVMGICSQSAESPVLVLVAGILVACSFERIDGAWNGLASNRLVEERRNSSRAGKASFDASEIAVQNRFCFIYAHSSCLQLAFRGLSNRSASFSPRSLHCQCVRSVSNVW